MTRTQAPRADAVRNRKKILDAAREQITRHGADVGMDEIAATAGVAVGTLYRHFPTKKDLVTAVVNEHIAHVTEAAEAARARQEAGSRALEEVTGLLARLIEETATNHAVKAAAHSLGADLVDKDAKARGAAALAALIAAGQADGDIHQDVTVNDIFLLFSTAPTDQSPADRARWLTLVLTGLTTHNRAVDTPQPPTP
ncbi:TetR/AcrR family transcriptional regulator [Streptomyces sp. NPDC005017]|uniref:TetR/AcrR family transcriptional regulator n=1 Tax=Streptomyces sp. NPDC005017 TaxID=3364706 RepID=UPI0036AB4092